MDRLTYVDGTYRTAPGAVSRLARACPRLSLYLPFLEIVWRASGKAKRGRYGDEEWLDSSMEVLRLLERIGVRFAVTGAEHLEGLGGPCVLIANHMSTMETVVLPAMAARVMPLTFMVKQSLLTFPVFRHVMRSRNPIALTRTNPREDLKAVLEGGPERVGRGVSIAVFPQSTRAVRFDPAAFSSIGVKLALKAGVPVVPVALKSDAWGNGKHLKDFGPVDVSRPARFAFGPPLRVQGRGADEHRAVIDFIQQHLAAWAGEVAGEGEPEASAPDAKEEA